MNLPKFWKNPPKASKATLLFLIMMLTGCQTTNQIASSVLGIEIHPEEHPKLAGFQIGEPPALSDAIDTLKPVGLTVGKDGAISLISQNSCSGITIESHRGDSRYPENSLEAIRLALSVGFHSIEIDTRRLRSGTWVLHHDPVTGRATSTPNGKIRRIDSMSTQDWSTLRLRKPGSNELTSISPPTLKSGIKMFAAHAKQHQKLNIEIKSDASLQSLQEVDIMAREQLTQGQYYYSSTDIETLRKIRAINPDIYLGIIQKPEKRSIDELLKKTRMAVGDDPVYNNYKSDIESFAASRGRTYEPADYTSPKSMRHALESIGPPTGLHLDIRTIMASPSVVMNAHGQGFTRVASYSINGSNYHQGCLRKLASLGCLPDVAIMDTSPVLMCRQLSPPVCGKRDFNDAQTPLGQLIASLPCDADFEALDLQKTYIKSNLYIDLLGRIKPTSISSNTINNTTNLADMTLPELPKDEKRKAIHNSPIIITLPIEDIQ